VWDVLPPEVQHDVLHMLARLLTRWFGDLEQQP
jgi:hypothetical protein